MNTQNLSTLKIHKLTKEQYERELAAGNIDEYALYLTPDEEIDLSGYATVEQLNSKADADHNHNDTYYTETEVDTLLANKAASSHSHTVADVTNLQSTLDAKATQTDLDTHTADTAIHITSTERTNWNAAKTHADSAHAPSDAEKNQNAFSNVTVGSTTIVADSVTDTLTLVAGGNVTITPDATDDKITISATDTTYSAGTGISLSGTTFNNSGVRSIETGTTKGAVSVNTNGTITSVPVYGLGSAAYTDSTAYDAAGAANTALDSAKTYTDTKITNMVGSSSVSAQISNHNTSTSAHSDIRGLIADLTSRLNTLADSDDTTLDQLSEIVSYIKSNRTLIEEVTTNKVNVSDIVDNLTTSDESKPLSAKQGVAIKGLIDALQTVVDGKSNLNHTHTIADVVDLQAELDDKVSVSRTINGKALSTDIALSASDVDAYSKAEIDGYSFITVDDIDEICEATIQTASEVKF